MGERVDGQEIRPLENLEQDVERYGASIGIITTPSSAAQETADRLTGAGIRSILNFAPTVVRVPANAQVRHVDLATELQILSYYSVQSR